MHPASATCGSLLGQAQRHGQAEPIQGKPCFLELAATVFKAWPWAPCGATRLGATRTPAPQVKRCGIWCRRRCLPSRRWCCLDLFKRCTSRRCWPDHAGGGVPALLSPAARDPQPAAGAWLRRRSPARMTHWTETIGDQTAVLSLSFPAGFKTFELGDSLIQARKNDKDCASGSNPTCGAKRKSLILIAKDGLI